MFAPFTVCSYMPSMCTLYPDISTLTQVGMHTAHMPASLLSELLVFTLLLIFFALFTIRSHMPSVSQLPLDHNARRDAHRT